MGFSFKESFKNIGKKIQEGKDKVITNMAQKVNDSSMVIDDFPRFIEFIESTKNKVKFIESAGKDKEFIRRGALIITPTNGDWYKKLITWLPVIYLKTFSSNIPIKIADSSMPGFMASAYEITEFPTMLLLENGEIKERVIGEKAIEKVVKKLSLDIM